jgi:hypothetical protein
MVPFRISGHGCDTEGWRQHEAAPLAIGRTTTPEVEVEQRNLLQMLSQQPDYWPPAGCADRGILTCVARNSQCVLVSALA